jgi:ABC-2 type transport system permease protein
VSAAASPVAATLSQTAMELRLTARRGENLLAMVGIPVAVLVFFGAVDVLPAPAGGGSRIEALLPGVLALAIIATGLVNLGIATAYERSYGVLKRLGGSPLGRTGLVGAKLLTVLVIVVAQVIALVGIAWFAFGWRPGVGASLPLLVGGLLLGTATFAGLGLAMAGSLRAEATLTLANALFLGFLLLGGLIVPADRLPDALAQLSGLLPSSALAEVFRAALGEGVGDVDVGRSLVILALWAVGAIAIAARSFRWE